MPFGGGKHLCPGRNFAFAEILGMMTVLLLGFEVRGVTEKFLQMPTPKFGEAVPKPLDNGAGGSVGIERRNGWENVEWRFSC